MSLRRRILRGGSAVMSPRSSSSTRGWKRKSTNTTGSPNGPLTSAGLKIVATRSAPPIGAERPGASHLVVAEDVDVAIAGLDAEVAMTGPRPAILHVTHLEAALPDC